MLGPGVTSAVSAADRCRYALRPRRPGSEAPVQLEAKIESCGEE